MKDSGAENCSPALLSPSSTTAWLTSSLCKQPPHLSQRHSRCSAEWLSPFQASGERSLHLHGQSVQRAERSRAQHAGRQILHLPFHSEYTQRAESRHAASESHTPPLRIGCWLLWRHACRHSNRLSDYYLFFIWPGFELIHLMMWSPLVMEAAAESRPKN